MTDRDGAFSIDTTQNTYSWPTTSSVRAGMFTLSANITSTTAE